MFVGQRVSPADKLKVVDVGLGVTAQVPQGSAAWEQVPAARGCGHF